MPKLILASGSPRRSELLSEWGYSFEIEKPEFDEGSAGACATPEEYVTVLALGKATEVGNRLKRKDAIVLGADTIVVLGKQVFGKPKDEAEAIVLLKKLSGRAHRVITGLALFDWEHGVTLTQTATSIVVFRRLSLTDIMKYVSSGEGSDKAGGYAIQGKGGGLIAKLKGSMENVIGLPKAETGELLGKYNIVPDEKVKP